MPLRAAQLFVRCGSLEELGEALGRALQKAGRPAQERTLLALHQREWATVLGEDPGAALSQPLSERFGTALELHLDGSQLALTVQTWESGEPGDEERDPQPPGFRDVEQVAWELLQYLGVPPSLRLLQLAHVEVLREESASALQGILLRSGRHHVQMWAVPVVPPPRAEGASPPTEPDVVVESKAGEARALEVRSLPGGIPTAAWAEALAAIEEAQALRLLRALAGGDEPRMPRPTFAYRSLQALRVGKLLAQARRNRPWLWKLLDPEREPPLTRAGFTQLCRGKMGELGVARAHGEHLEVEAGPGVRVRAPVRQVYEVYLSKLDAEAAAEQLARETRALVEAKAPAISAEHLLPTLVAGEAGLICDDGKWIRPVLPEALVALGLDFEAALERAVARADALTDAAPEGIRWFDLEHGRVVVCEFADAGGAGRLFSRHVRGLLLRILGADFALAAAPTRDALLACAADDDEGAAWLADEARRRFSEGPFAIAADLWLIGADILRPAER